MSATVLASDRYLDYHFGPEHPFSPVRLEMLHDLLDRLGISLNAVEPPAATRDDVLSVHAEALVEQVEAASNGAPTRAASRYGLNTADVPVFEGMDAAARSLVGGTLHGAQLIHRGDADRVLQLGGGLHHAQRKRASGFCVYNDLSVAIQHLRDAGHRVAYLDVDVHHGDGVQDLHYDDPEVLTISLHESGRYLFPGTGNVHETGEGAGEGTSLNVPLEPFTEDDSFLQVFDRVVPYALSQFQPDVLMVQCGADAHFSDPLADLLLTTGAYETLFRTHPPHARRRLSARRHRTHLGNAHPPRPRPRPARRAAPRLARRMEPPPRRRPHAHPARPFRQNLRRPPPLHHRAAKRNHQQARPRTPRPPLVLGRIIAN